MKVWLIAGLMWLSLASPVFADCGHCGMEGGHAKEGASAGAHTGAQCPMHGDKNNVLLEAAEALADSDPELSAKLKDMAENCCGGHA